MTKITATVAAGYGAMISMFAARHGAVDYNGHCAMTIVITARHGAMMIVFVAARHGAASWRDRIIPVTARHGVMMSMVPARQGAVV